MTPWILVALMGVAQADPATDCPALAGGANPDIASASWSASSTCASDAVSFALDADADDYADEAGRCCVTFVCTSDTDDTDVPVVDTDSGSCVPADRFGDFLWEDLLADTAIDCNAGSSAVNATTSFYADCDGDLTTSSTLISACDAAEALTATVCSGGATPLKVSELLSLPTDCDDEDPTGTADETWYPDCDADGLQGASVSACGETGALGTCGSTETGASASTTAGSEDCDDEDDGVAGPFDWFNDCDGDDKWTRTPVQACDVAGAEAQCPAGSALDGEDATTTPPDLDAQDCNDQTSVLDSAVPYRLDCDGDGRTGTEQEHACSVSNATTYAVCTSTGVAPLGAQLIPDLFSDCDDAETTVQDESGFYLDCDGDGFTVDTPADYCGEDDAIATGCSGAAGAQAQTTPSSKADCDDTANGVGGQDTWYLDCDGDGIVADTYTDKACSESEALNSGACPGGLDPTTASTTLPSTPDCDDDDNAAADPDQVWYQDCDGDDVTSAVSVQACTADDAKTTTCSVTNVTPLKVSKTRSSPVDCSDYDNSAFESTDWYRDCDADGFYDPTARPACGVTLANSTYPCGLASADSWTDDPTEGGTQDADCDDADSDEKPGRLWFPDCDNDGAFRATGVTACAVEDAAALDPCDGSAAPTVKSRYYSDPDATSLPGANTDCDDDDVTGSVADDWYVDCDGDTFFDATPLSACGETGAFAAATCPDGTVDDVTNVAPTDTTDDCADDDAARFPGAAEVCNGLDDDCDDVLPADELDVDDDKVIACNDCDDGDPTGSVLEDWYPDCDGDGTFDSVTVNACGVVGATAAKAADCDATATADRWTTTTPVDDTLDCDDRDEVEFPGRVWFGDCDNDGAFDPAGVTACALEDVLPVSPCGAGVAPAGGWYADTDAVSLPVDDQDCDDSDPTAQDVLVWYPDCDGDTAFADDPTAACGLTAAQAAYDCPAPVGVDDPLGGFTTVDPDAGADCDDGDALQKPGQTWYADCDDDGAFRGTPVTTCLESDAITAAACAGGGAPDGGWVYAAPTPGDEDCDDADGTEFPGRPWYSDCDDDGTFAVTPVIACDVAEADAGGACVDNATPDGGWYSWSESNPSPDTADLDCDDEDPTGSDTENWYRDCDADGFEEDLAVAACGASGADAAQACTNGAGLSAWTTSPSADKDCDDLDADEFPDRSWFPDCDGDAAFSVTAVVACAVEDAVALQPCDDLSAPDGGWYADSSATTLPSDEEDCDDEDPAAFEVESWYPDCDGDGFDAATPISACGLLSALDTYDCPAPDGVVSPLGSFTNVDPGANADCDDGDADQQPGQTWFPDCDGDGAYQDVSVSACLRADAVTLAACGSTVGLTVTAPTPGAEDCDDDDEREFPGRDWFPDCDGDLAWSSSAITACDVAEADAATPCVDAEAPDGGWFDWTAVQPGPDTTEQDCNDEDPTGSVTEDWYRDCDGDLFEDPTPTAACGTTRADAANPCPAGAGTGTWTTSPSAGDCDDADGTEFPTRVWYADCDGDGAFREAGVNACAQEDAETAGTTPCDDDAAPDGGWFAFASGSPAPAADIADCLDEDALSFPGQIWFPDCDDDGAFDDPRVGSCGLDPASDDAVTACSADDADDLTTCLDGEAPDGGWVPGAIPTDPEGEPYEDCDDETRFRSPLESEEVCESVGLTQIDDDCNCDVNSAGPEDDLQDPTNPRAFYRDQDGDGFGSTEASAVEFGCQVADDQSITNTDCDDRDPDVYLGALEVCDGVDQNCNGAVDEPDFLDPDNANCAPLYLDLDGDGFGDPLEPQCLCASTDADGSLVGTYNGQDYVQLNTDCDDNHAFILPDACNNGADDDGDGALDDGSDVDCGQFPWPVAADDVPRWYRTNAEVSSCEDGEDDDGDGLTDDADPDCPPAACVDTDVIDCETRTPGLGIEPWPRREGDACVDGVDNDSDGLSDEDDPDCAPITVSVEGVTRTFRPTFESEEALIASGLVRQEIADGHDNECDGKVPVVELDCDDDGGLPVPLNAIDAYHHAGDLGLARCVDEPRQLSCWGEQLSIECDEVTGLWVTRYGSSEDGFGGRYSGAYRNLDDLGCDVALDCDDQCAARCPGASESCDGLDNDCSGVAYTDVDDDGIPDAMDVDVPVLGTVASAEVDLDGDEALACEEEFRVGAAQVQTAPYTCTLPAEFGPSDCTSLCYLAAPDREEACNGFVDVCGASSADREGTDADDDGYVTCGAYGPVDGTLVEQIFVPAWVSCAGAALFSDTDVGAASVPSECDGRDTSMLTGAEPSIVPLLAPRGDAIVCDEPLATAIEAVMAATGLSGDAPATSEALVDALCHDDNGGVCTVLVLEVDATNVIEVDASEALESGSLPAACEDTPSAWRARTVWNKDRIVQARQGTVALECLRLYGAPCDEVGATAPQIGTSAPPDVAGALDDDTLWWMELQRFRPTAAAGALMTCWGDPRDREVSTDVGGDCDDTRSTVHRDVAEGPDDVVTKIGLLLGAAEGVDCSTCYDRIDNNCDGAIDCKDPSCAVCFVGGGTGCASGRDACADPAEGCASGGARPMAAVLLVVGLLGRRRRRSPAA